jgi:hypothetical protein
VLCDIFNFLRNAAAIYRHSSGGLSFSLPPPDIFKNYVFYCLKNISMIFDFLPKIAGVPAVSGDHVVAVALFLLYVLKKI